MNFDFPKLLNSAVEGFVFFTHRYFEAVYLLLRYPMRGAHYLSYRNLKRPDASISPYVFILINLIIGFIAIAVAGPLIFTNLPTIARSANALIHRIENSDFNFLPLILRSL